MARKLAGRENNNRRVSDPPSTNVLVQGNRRREIVRKAAEFFATVGFDGGTRDFAKYLGTTQPLLYRYFPTKEALIQEVYQMVYLELWDDKWDAILTDSGSPLRERLIAFYVSYTDMIMNTQWMRLYLFAGLKGVEINTRYINLVEDRIIKVIVREVWKDRKLPVPTVIDKCDMEIVWNLQGGIFYFGVRANVYNVPTFTDKNEMITNAVDIFLAGYAMLLERRSRW
jgi:AcrR family transcriptional regulator